MSQKQPIIRLEKVHKSFNGQPVLNGVSLTIAPGQTTVIIGPSGCGKSVLLKHIVGILKPDQGRVFFRDQDLTDLGERELAGARRQIGFLFQGGALFDSMTVLQNIAFPLEEHHVGTPALRRERVRQVLTLVGLDGIQAKYPEELSGGQKKRVALARALALDPKVILYDEPTTGLDPIRSDLINELILKLQGELQTTAVVVTHDMASARKIGDRIVMLYRGKIIADASPENLAKVDNSVVRHFVEGRASDEELAELRSGRLQTVMNANGEDVENE